MKKNLGITERIIRVLIAIVIAACFFTHIITGLVGVILLILAGIFVLTSFISFCPIWAVLGIHTNKKNN